MTKDNITPPSQSPEASSTPKATRAARLKQLKAAEVLPENALPGAAAEPLGLSSLPLDHRYQTAAAAAFEGRLLSRRRHARSTCELADYLTARDVCEDEGQRLEVDRRFEDVALALQARSGSEGEIGFLIEAYTLARLGTFDVHVRDRMKHDAVKRYQELFCAYGWRLDNRAYVVREAGIENALTSTDPTLQRKGVLLLIGYFCGWRALDALVWTRGPGERREVWDNLLDTADHLQLFNLVRSVVQAAFTGCDPPRSASDYAAIAAQLTPLLHRYELSNTPKQNIPMLGMIHGSVFE